MDGVTAHLGLLNDATARLLNTVDGLTDSRWSEPSLLPGWTRAHVVAHLALNAEGLARASAGVTSGSRVPMYDSNESRDGDIDRLATSTPTELRERLATGCRDLSGALAELAPERLDTMVERTPGRPAFPARDLVDMRWREVEIHHADLGSEYTARDWSAEFADYLLPVAAWDRGGDLDLVLRTPDGEVAVGAGTGPAIEGSAAELGWWLVGRGHGEGLSGDLPSLGPWTRRSRPTAAK
jgi:maleylpyruvate isomerase